MYKKVISLLLIIVLLSSMAVFADGETWLTEDDTEAIFTDVNQGDWFYEAVMTMNRYGIIAGDGDGKFRPLDSVARQEFAVMMVKALKLEIKEPASSFVDVADGYWASKWIETAKPYLTGYIKNGEFIFKPTANAVREDMAVALVQALNKPTDSSVLVALEGFEDADDISPNLKNYVASAVHHNLMSGTVVDGKKYIKPMLGLTRAEAAALLLSVVKEEKIVFDDEEKIVLEDGDFVLSSTEKDGGVKLTWDYNTDADVSGYKVVASKSDETPAYPENGYARYLQDSSHVIYTNDSYSNGDFDKFVAGETYYVSITALVGDEKISSNVIQITMPLAISQEGKVPEVSVSQLGEGIVIEWNSINTDGLQGYKVVASKEDSTPVYPTNGYATWITELSTKSYYIKPGSSYKGGDFGGVFKSGEKYYFSITAVYDSGKIAGNTVEYIMPGDIEPEVTTEQKTPVVEAAIVDGKLVVEWSAINTSGLNGYKIVASRNNPTPVYSEDGYAYWITDLSTYRKEIYPNTSYNGGDLEGKFESGISYYVSVTAVYNDQKIRGNAVRITMP